MFTPDPNAIQVVGMRRSGIHAIVDWIACKLFNLDVHILNNCRHDRGHWIYYGRTFGSTEGGKIEIYEDMSPEQIAELPEGRDRIVVLRDPYNTAASRFKKGWKIRSSLWKLYAKGEFGDNIISYNHWLKESWAPVPCNGGGSSFDKIKYDGMGHEMKVEERWLQYKGEPWMRSLLEDKELRELSIRMCGFDPKG